MNRTRRRLVESHSICPVCVVDESRRRGGQFRNTPETCQCSGYDRLAVGWMKGPQIKVEYNMQGVAFIHVLTTRYC